MHVLTIKTINRETKEILSQRVEKFRNKWNMERRIAEFTDYIVSYKPDERVICEVGYESDV